MKKSFLLYLTTLLVVNSFAQKGMDGLIHAEQSFADSSMANGVKKAFLAFMDENSLVFDKGKPENGIRVWNNRERKRTYLNWHPATAEISSSNDFGYTTGPWTIRVTGPTDSIVARGYYSTLWHINKEGKWVFLIDLGTDQSPVAPAGAMVRITAAKTAVAKTDTGSLIHTENEFIRLYNTDPSAAYKKYLSATCLLNRNGHLPAGAGAMQDSLINTTSSAIQFSIDGWILSPGLDMGCVYGSTVLNDKQDNYMRIWRHERDGWKIALDVIRQ